jgi:predicted transcriptional regulator
MPGIRQSDLAERVGVSVSTIRKIEAGDRRVELGTMLHVLWQLGILRDVMSQDRDSMQKAVLSSRRVRLPSVQKEDF